MIKSYYSFGMRCFYFRNCNQLSTFYMLEMCLCMHFPLPSWSMKIYLTFFCSLRKLIRHRICIYPISIDNNILTAILFFLPPLILLVGLWDWECRVEGGMVDCVNKFPFFFYFSDNRSSQNTTQVNSVFRSKCSVMESFYQSDKDV